MPIPPWQAACPGAWGSYRITANDLLILYPFRGFALPAGWSRCVRPNRILGRIGYYWVDSSRRLVLEPVCGGTAGSSLH